MAGKKVVADKTEVLRELTAIFRDENNKIADRMKAADNIVKLAEEAETEKKKADSRPTGVMIVDDIPRGAGDG